MIGFCYHPFSLLAMSYDLLNDVEVEKSFSNIRKIASVLENAVLSRSNNVADAFQSSPGAPPGRHSNLHSSHSTLVGEGSTGAGEEDEFLFIPSVLSLPKSCGQETVQLVSKLGHALTVLVDKLQKQTDGHFVAFFAHMKKKEASELEEICAKRKIMPKGFVTHTQLVGMQFPPTSINDGEPSSPPEPTGLDAVLPLAGAASVEDALLSANGPADPLPNAGSHMSIGGGALRNAPLARKLKERREAASTLQSFLFLVLESSIAQCEASCAAVFLNGLSYKETKLGSRGSSPAVNVFDDIDRDGPPRFLHCVANLYGDSKFPNEISYATLNPLTAVVQTGVAVNLRNTECPQLPNVDGENRELGTEDNVTESLKKNIHKVLNINTGLLLPLGDFGCLVVANKKSSAVVNSFTVSDEHVAWGAALFITTVLTRYRKDLLLDNPWFPSHIPALRKFISLPTVKEVGKKQEMRSRLRLPPELETTVNNNFGTLGNNLMTFISEGRGANMPRRLTMVRTADPQIGHVVPSELLPRNRTRVATAEQVSEEEIFQGAAQYISNLESLWHKTLAENNAAHLVMQNYDREVESRNEEIRALEAKVRKLNARIVQLERQRGRSF